MPLSASAESTAAPRAPSAATKILLAVSDHERRLFFPGNALRPLPNLEHVDARGMGRSSWDRLIKKHRPSILITGWSTPALEPEHTVAAGGPVEYVCHVAGSVRHLVSLDMIQSGLRVTNWGNLIAPQVAEHALLTVLALMRNLGRWRSTLSASGAGNATEQLATRSLIGKTVAIHGFGAIARSLVELLQPFRVKINAFSAGVPEEFMRRHRVTPVASLQKLAEKADVFVTCEALTSESTSSINERVLTALPEGAVFVNVGRGAVVDEVALAKIAAARGLRVGSDVFVCEPLPSDSPLMDLPGAIFSPHIAGPTLDSYAECGRQAIANIEQHLAGKSLSGLVTPEIFIRST